MTTCRATRLRRAWRAAKLPHMIHDSLVRSGLEGCFVISLRPVNGHGAMRRAASTHGARVVALSPWRLVLREDVRTRAHLREALSASRVVATSPAAVRASHALQPLHARRGQRWFAVGTGTAAALRRTGIRDVVMPARMDSEGLLALPGLQEVGDADIAVLTAPGGRDRIAPALRERGARVVRVDVYARVPVEPSPRSLAALRALAPPFWLAVSSAGAVRHLLATVPADVVAIVAQARVVASSARLATLARQLGWHDIVIAADARPRSLLDAAAGAAPARRRAR